MRLWSFFALALLGAAVALEPPADGGPDIAKLPNFDGISDQSINDLKQKLKLKMDQMPPEARKGEFKRLFDKLKKVDGKGGKGDRKKRPERPERPDTRGGWKGLNPGSNGRPEKGSRVLKVVGNEVNDAISSAELALVEFYAPWCGHCKKLAPEFDKASNLLAPFGVTLIAVDATESDNKVLSSKFGVKGYPTLKIIKGGDVENASDYKGPRTAEGIANFMKRMQGATASEEASGMPEPQDSEVIVLTPDNFTKTLRSADLVLVEFYAPWCGHCKKLAPEFSEASTKLAGNNIVLAKMDATVESHKDMARNFGAKGFPTLRVFKDKNVVEAYEYKGQRTADDIVKYMTGVQSGEIELLRFKKDGPFGGFNNAMKKMPGMNHLTDTDMENMRAAFKKVPKDISPEERKASFEKIRKEFNVERKPFQ